MLIIFFTFCYNYIQQWSPNFLSWGRIQNSWTSPGQNEKKSLHFESISDFAIFFPKIVVISKKKKSLHLDSISSFAVLLLKSWGVFQCKEQGKNVKLGCSRYNSFQLWLKVNIYILKKAPRAG